MINYNTLLLPSIKTMNQSQPTMMLTVWLTMTLPHMETFAELIREKPYPFQIQRKDCYQSQTWCTNRLDLPMELEDLKEYLLVWLISCLQQWLSRYLQPLSSSKRILNGLSSSTVSHVAFWMESPWCALRVQERFGWPTLRHPRWATLSLLSFWWQLAQ